MRRTVATFSLLSCAACQAYTPVALTPTHDGKSVRVTLNTTGISQMAVPLGGAVDDVEGQLIDVSDTSIVVSVSGLTRSNGVDETWKGERVTIPRAGVAQLELRSVSASRSLLAAVVIGGGAFLIGHSIGGTEAQGPTGTTGGTPTPH